MKIAVVGATGATGMHFVEQALKNGHQLTALARTPAKLKGLSSEQLTVMQGDVRNQADVKAVVSGQDAIFCALGNGENTGKTDIRTAGTRMILSALAESEEKPHLVIVSSLGVNESKKQMSFFIGQIVCYILRHPFADHATQENEVRKSNLPWTILRPTGLSNDPTTGNILQTTPPQAVTARPMIPRADVAAIGLEIIENNSHINQAITLTVRK